MLKRTLVPDLLAGLTVSFAAIALGAAFGTMSGRGAFAGMMGAAIIPIIASIFGGTRLQASGPTAPMTAVSALVVAYAYENFPGDKALAEQFITLVFLTSAALMLFFSAVRLGKLIEFVPQVVIIGFMNGIALLIWYDQFIKLFGIGKEPFEGSLGVNVGIAVITLVLIYAIPFLLKRLNAPKVLRMFMPGALMAILLVTMGTSLFSVDVQHIRIDASIGTFAEFEQMLLAYFPTRQLFTSDMLLTALPYAAQLALLGYLDSLLTALVIDKMTGERSKLNKELLAQGLANGVSAIVQGIPGAQATIRSVLLVKEGAQTRLAGVMIGIFALLGILVLKDYLTLIVSAVFVGVLFKAGADVFETEFSRQYFKRKWFLNKDRNIQMGFVVYTTLVTVIFDLNIAVITGTILFYIGKYVLNFKDIRETVLAKQEQRPKIKERENVKEKEEPVEL